MDGQTWLPKQGKKLKAQSSGDDDSTLSTGVRRGVGAFHRGFDEADDFKSLNSRRADEDSKQELGDEKSGPITADKRVNKISEGSVRYGTAEERAALAEKKRIRGKRLKSKHDKVYAQADAALKEVKEVGVESFLAGRHMNTPASKDFLCDESSTDFGDVKSDLTIPDTTVFGLAEFVRRFHNDATLVANRSALRAGYGAKMYHYVERPNNVLLYGRFSFDLGGHIEHFDTYLEIPYMGEGCHLDGRPPIMSIDAVLAIVTERGVGELEEGPTPCLTHRGVEYPTVGGPKERVRFLTRSWLEKVINSKVNFDPVHFKNQVISEYKRFYRHIPELPETVTQIMSEAWFMETTIEYQKTLERDWPAVAEARLRSMCNAKGLVYDSIYNSMWWSYLYGTVMYTGFSVGFTVLAGFLCKKLGIFNKNYGYALGGVHCGVAAYKWGRNDQDRIIKRYLLDRGIDEFGGLTFVPASKKTLRKTQKPPSFRELPPLNPDVLLEFEEGPEVTQDEEVDVYGTTTGVPIVYPATNNDNLYQAVRVRMAYDRTYNQATVDRFVKFAKSKIDQMPEIQLEPMDVLGWLQSKYGLKKGERLFQLRDQPLTESDVWSTLFVKAEPYLGKNEETYKSRMIWSRSDRFVAHIVPYFTQVGNALKKYFDLGQNNHIFATGKTPALVGNAGAFLAELPFIKEKDVSGWDGSLLKEMLEVEKYHFETKVICNGLIDRKFLLQQWTLVWGSSKDGKVVYQAKYGRRSGDPWTSNYNSLLNKLITEFVFEELAPKDCEVRGLYNGDDNVVSSSYDVPTSEEVRLYAELGMTCKVIERNSIYETEFCSGLFWNVGGKPVWGNLPFRVLSKLGLNHGKHPSKLFQGLLYGTAKGMMSSAAHVPILGVIFEAISKSAKELAIKARVDNRWENPGRFVGGPTLSPTDETYLQFSERYGISMESIWFIEEAARQLHINSFPLEVKGEVLDRGLAIDLGVDEFSLHGENGNECSEYEEVTKMIPLEEETTKLVGVKSNIGAFMSGWAFGESECRLGAPSHHPFLHALLSVVSYNNLGIGIALHSSYNRLALACNAVTAGNPRKKNLPRPIHLPPKGMVEAEEKKEMTECPSCGMSLRNVYYIPHKFPPAARRKINPGQKKKGPKPKAKSSSQVPSGLRETLVSAAKAGAKAALIAAGGAVGGTIGMGDQGRELGAYVSRISGMGSYRVRMNSLGGRVPEFGSGKMSRVRVRRSEYLGDVTGSTSFTLKAYSLNPGLYNTCPWGHPIALQHLQYKFLGAAMVYKSTSADALNSTNTALGTVIMATETNPNRSNYRSKLEMEAAQFASSGRPSEDIIHFIECDPKEKPLSHLYVRGSDLDSGEDVRFYDWGTFQIATVGMQAAATIGELWFTYDVEFVFPRITPGIYNGVLSATINNASYDNTDVLGDLQTTVFGGLPVTIEATGSGYDTIVFGPSVSTGTFLVNISWKGSSTACTLANPTLSNLTYPITDTESYDYFGWSGNQGHNYSPGSGSTTTRASWTGIVRVDGYDADGSSIQFSGMTLPSSGTSVDIYICPVPQTYSNE
jgi:hypothetical protein